MIDTARIDAVVVGGSAGAFKVLQVLLPALPAALSLPVLIVMHLPENRPTVIADIFSRSGPLQAREAEDKEPLVPGMVYIAPPGYHLLVERERSLALSTDEPVHHSRPSIDMLFESAAEAWGDRLLGIVLSGASEDGAAGLRAVADRGGQAVVQDPASAEHPMMPLAAMEAADAVSLQIDEIAALLATLRQGEQAP